ncbi:hypothetical protein [Gilliamella sp. Fer4-1]|uniref:hypothetical protein n=1 Tax=Gilliamella sp. Fer4-1 TaxID=3120242 RepID=UPI001C40067F|nr:hypothetical protein [Gilliamella apicola]
MPPLKQTLSRQSKWFTEGDAQTPPSHPGADWFNIVQAELLNVLKAGDVEPSKSDLMQLTTAIKSIITKNRDAIGDQRLMPFRRDELPFGWYFRNGDNFLLDSPQGQALNSLSENYKTDHWITIKTIDGKQYINVPTAFASDGRGYFERAVDGVARRVGSMETDAIRDMYGEFSMTTARIEDVWVNVASAIGVFKAGGYRNHFSDVQSKATYPDYATPERLSNVVFDAARVVPTAKENRPINIGMTPAIYLGV